MELLTILIAPVSALALAGFAVLLQKTATPPRARVVESVKRAETLEASLKDIRKDIEEIKEGSTILYTKGLYHPTSIYRIAALRRGAKGVQVTEEMSRIMRTILGPVHR